MAAQVVLAPKQASVYLPQVGRAVMPEEWVADRVACPAPKTAPDQAVV
jgi:hypothetical protein